MAATSDRNAEIWSTRLQREILALESTDDASKKLELLPPFITTVGHTLNIEGGIAKIEFRIDVERGPAAAAAEVEDGENLEDGSVDKTEEKTEEKIGEAQEAEGLEKTETKEEKTEKEEVQDVKAETADNTTPEPVTSAENTVNEQEQPNQETSTKETEATEATKNPHIILVLDASMYWEQSSASGKSSHPQFYPFMKPLAVIKSGSQFFSGGSTIGNGDEVDIDLDWTPRWDMILL